MKKINIAALIIIALGILTLFVITVFFNFYTYNEDGSIHGDWLASESAIYSGTARIISNITACFITIGILLLLISRDKKANENFSGVLFIALGVLAVIGSLNQFHPCTEMMRMNDRPMRCYWTMKAVLAVAGIISISGILMLLFNKSRDFIKGLNCAVIMLSCLLFLIPVKITGLCLTPMVCIERFRPFILMMSSIMIASSVINAFLLNKKVRPQNRKMNKK